MENSTATEAARESQPSHKSPLTFFLEFLRHPMEIGSVIPSSRFLEQRILSAAAVEDAQTVVELGCGTGGTTQAILNALPSQARLLSLDVNPRFHEIISGFPDRRLIPHLGTAADLSQVLNQYGLGKADAVISGIPFSTMDKSLGAKIVSEVSISLKDDGRFVAYQASPRVRDLTNPLMGSGSASLELLNIPPMRVFRWCKR